MISKVITTDKNRQRLYLGVAIAGFGLFLYQVSDLLADHSTWSEIAAPASVGEIAKLLGGAILTSLAALGYRLPGTPAAIPVPVSNDTDASS